LILEDHELTFLILQELLTSGLECVLLLLERILVLDETIITRSGYCV
jgi:hypothetical protein